MFLKGHVASIAIILLLGVAIASFLFLVKQKSQERGEELVKEITKNKVLDKLEYGIMKSCEEGEYYLIIDFPAIIDVYSKGKALCIEEECKDLNIDCEIEELNRTFYKEEYEIFLNRTNSSISIEVSFWQ